MDHKSTMTPRFKRALLAYIAGTLTDAGGVDELVMAALYNLRGEALDADLRRDLEMMIRRVELLEGRYRLSSESLQQIQKQEVI